MQRAATALAALAALVHDVEAQCPSAGHVSAPTGTLPSYAGDSGFDTTGLVPLEQGSEMIELRYTASDPPQGWDQRTDCPHLDQGLSNWHDPATWGGSVPAAGAAVTIPENTRVLVSDCSLESTPYGLITVPASSELIFNENDIDLHTAGILVNGKLRIGSESCRLYSSISITLHGARPNIGDSMDPAYKGIAAVGSGVLDIHGALFHPTWTRLATTATAGASEIFLQHRVNWQPGQEVVVTGTEIKDARDWHRNEVRTISSVAISGSFSRIGLSEPLSYTHKGGEGFQGEVGLLSRNVVVQGDASSEPTDTDDDVCSDNIFTSYPCPNKHLTGFGGHMIAMGPSSTARVSGVELFRMGQTNFLARYPFHLHMMGDGGEGSYLTHSSVHHSFYRCAVVHGSNEAIVSDNVAYDAIGHCFYLEDGVEERNTLSYNLAAHVHFMEYPPTAGAQFIDWVTEHANLVNPADTTASGFYITNLYNRIVGNAASGGYSGFAIVKLPKPIQLHKDLVLANGLNPVERPALEFDGNSCHSSGWWWNMAGCVYVGGRLEHMDNGAGLLHYGPGRDISNRDTRCDNGQGSYEPCAFVMSNTKVFLANWGVNNWGARSEIHGLEAYDTQRGAGLIGTHYLTKYLAVCRSGFEPERPPGNLLWTERRWWEHNYIGFQWYDTAQFHAVSDATFRNCGNAARNSPVWETLTHSDRYVPGVMQGTSKIRYENVDMDWLVRPTIDSHVSVSGWLTSWFDVDGSVFGTNQPTIIGNAREYNWWKLDDSCVTEAGGWFSCPQLSPRQQRSRNVASFDFVHDKNMVDRMWSGELNICGNEGYNPPPCPALGMVTHLGWDKADGIPLTANPRITGPTGGLGFLILVDKGSPLEATFDTMQIDELDTVLIVMPYPPGTEFNIWYQGPTWCNSQWYTCNAPVEPANSVAEVREGRGDLYYFDESAGLLFFRLVSLGIQEADFDADLNLQYFEHDGVRIPPIMWGGSVEVRASGCSLNPDDSRYCAPSYDAQSVQADPCALHGIVGHDLYGYDECVASSGGPSPPSPSPPSPSPPSPSPPSPSPPSPSPPSPSPPSPSPPSPSAPSPSPPSPMPEAGTPSASPTTVEEDPDTLSVAAHNAKWTLAPLLGTIMFF